MMFSAIGKLGKSLGPTYLSSLLLYKYEIFPRNKSLRELLSWGNENEQRNKMGTQTGSRRREECYGAIIVCDRPVATDNLTRTMHIKLGRHARLMVHLLGHVSRGGRDWLAFLESAFSLVLKSTVHGTDAPWAA